MKEKMKNFALLAVSCLLYAPAVYCEIMIQDGRNQQSLPIEKQKSLATFDPEDVFPTQTGDDGKSPKRNKKPLRPTAAARTTVRPPFVIVPAPTPKPTPLTPPEETRAAADPSPLPTPIPSATPAASAANLTPEDTTPQPATRASMQILGLLTFLVSTALIFVILKLMAKLREGSG